MTGDGFDGVVGVGLVGFGVVVVGLVGLGVVGVTLVPKSSELQLLQYRTLW